MSPCCRTGVPNAGSAQTETDIIFEHLYEWYREGSNEEQQQEKNEIEKSVTSVNADF